jgi:membrane-associated phospholipid phosphatase
LRGAVAAVRGVDERLLDALRFTPAGGPTQSTMESTSLAAEHGVLWFSLGGVMAAIDGSRRHAWLLAGCSAPISILVNLLLKQIVRRPRPARSSEEADAKRTSFSFPSAHATSSFTAATIVRQVEPRLLTPAMALASLVAYSRIYLAKHYPLDVAAGAGLGIGLGLAASRLTSGRQSR